MMYPDELDKMKYPNEIDFKKVPRLGKDEIYVAVGFYKSDYLNDDGTYDPAEIEVQEYKNKPDLRKGLTEYIPCKNNYKYKIYIAKKVVI